MSRKSKKSYLISDEELKQAVFMLISIIYIVCFVLSLPFGFSTSKSTYEYYMHSWLIVPLIITSVPFLVLGLFVFLGLLATVIGGPLVCIVEIVLGISERVCK